MNITSIHDFLKGCFSEVITVKPAIFRAQQDFEQRPVGVYYFDCTDVLEHSDFDLTKYQDEILAENYYANQGSVRWSYYLYFVCSQNLYNQVSQSDRCSRIERDKIFTRKYVIREDLLASEFDKRSKASKSWFLPEDISIRWIKALKAKKLDGIFMPHSPRTTVVDNFIQGTPILEDNVYENSHTSQINSPLSFIDALTIKKYRPYPKIKDFRFGTVNLIEGANGCGKTSLLEAIEYWICGETFRSRGSKSPEAEIGLKFSGDSGFKWNELKNREVYRARDLTWYGNHYAKGNRLCQGFNRFNFYDADAAANISGGLKKDSSIRNAITNLILGETASIIEERLQSILVLFNKEQGHYQDRVRFCEKEISDANTQLNTLGTSIAKHESLFEEFIGEVRRLGWRGNLPRQEEASVHEFVQAISSICVHLENAISDLDWISTLSINAIQAEALQVGDLLKKVEATRNELHTLQESIKPSKEEEALLIAWKNLKALQPYFTNEEASGLLSLSEKISSKQEEVKRTKEAQSAIKGINFNLFANESETFDAAETKHATRLITFERITAEQTAVLEELNKKNGRIKTLITELRSKAKELLNHNPNLDHCPVCNANYKLNELADRINQEESLIDQLSSAHTILENLARVKAETEMTRRHLRELRQIKAAITSLHGEDCNYWLIAKAIQNAKGLDQLVLQLEKERTVLVELKQRLLAKNLHQAEYEKLMIWLEVSYKEESFDPSQSENYQKLLAVVESRVQEAEANRQLNLKICSAKADLITTLIQTYLEVDQLDPQRPAEFEVRKRQKHLDTALKIIGNISTQNVLGSKDNLLEFVVGLKELQAACIRYMSLQKRNEEVEQVRRLYAEKLARMKSQLVSAQTKMDRAEEAIETIQEILQKESKEIHLQAFLKNNIEEIVETFKSIHAPREFSDIEFGQSENSSIFLIRKGSGVRSPISCISSGQRSALALAIFMVLNRKLRNGPPFLLFDDPIAYVDDLNILSFLDHLRDLAFEGGRQIFFATANQKLSTLFKKKFDVFGDKFCTIPLLR